MLRRLIPVAMLLMTMAMSVAFPSTQKGAGHQKVIKDPAEYNAYITALTMKDPAQKAAGMEAFVSTYPDSVVKIDALEQAMAAYQQTGNTEKVAEVARRILDLHPRNVRALAVITYILRSGSDPTQACPFAQNGLQTLSTLEQPENLSEGDFHKLRAQMADIFYGALGACALEKKDYGRARDYYQKALQIDPINLQNTYQTGIADLETNPVEVNGFWYIAKAMNLAQTQGNPQASQGMETYGKEKYRKYHGSDDGWDEIVRAASSESAPPADFSFKVPAIKTPCELAVAAAEQGECCVYTDAEFILRHRDCSPANKLAADRIWQSIQNLQKDRGKLKIPIKVISATNDTIRAAISDDDRKSNTADVQITMEKPMTHPPAAGSNITVLGIMTSYTSEPFMFTVGNGELVAAKPAVQTQLSAADVEKLLQGGVTPKRTTELVKQKGVDFTLDGATEARLRKAGATDELLLAIATSKKP